MRQAEPRAEPQRGLTRPDRQWRQSVLLLEGAGLVYLLNARSGGPTLLCPLRAWTGIPCPCCGMTRSLSAVVVGDWRRSWDWHAFGIPLAVLALSFGLGWSLELWRGRRSPALDRLTRWLLRLWPLGLLALLAYHGVRLGYWWQQGWLPAWIAASPLAHGLPGSR